MAKSTEFSFKVTEFLERCQSKLARLHDMESIWIIMGNESCDLDSAVCALIYAFYQNCMAEISAINTFNKENAEYTEKDYEMMRNAFLAQAVHKCVTTYTDAKVESGSIKSAAGASKQIVCCAAHAHCPHDCSNIFFSVEEGKKLLNLKNEGMLKIQEHIARETNNTAIFPMLNVPKEQFFLKTEVTFFLKSHGVPLDKLIFRDTLNLEELKRTNKLNLILVDHHVLPPQIEYLSSSVKEIIDHRPQDPKSKWPEGVLNVVETGSCATLIVEKIWNVQPCMLTKEMASLLYGPIVLDTACFSPQAKRATPLDYRMAEILESIGGKNLQRSEVFDQLLAARTDISHLTSMQILNKDYKVILGIPIVGLPILVQDFIKRKDWWDAIKEWSDIQQSKIIILMGMMIDKQNTSRDLALVDYGNDTLVMQLKSALLNSKNPDLCLKEIPLEQSCIQLFQQQNIQASRKQVVPIITSVMRSVK